MLDNLIAEKKVPSTIGVLVANQGTRTRDMAMSAPFCDFLVKELVPRLRREYRASYHEYSGGHEFVSWRGSVADGLIALTAARAAPR